MNAIAPNLPVTPPPERDAITGLLCDALDETLRRASGSGSLDLAEIGRILRIALRRSNVELIQVTERGPKRTDTVEVVVHTQVLAQRNWLMRMLEARVPEGVTFVAGLQRTHDARVAELLEANNGEVERRRATEAQFVYLAAGLRKLIPSIGDQITTALAALDGERSKLVDDFITALQEP